MSCKNPAPGMCGQCGTRPAAHGKQCRTCYVNYKLYLDLRVMRGLCVKCGLPNDNGHRTCYKCVESNKIYGARK